MNLDFTFDSLMIIALIAAVIVGISKSGFKGVSYIFVSLLAIAYGSKASTGILLPMLIFGDAMAIFFFKKDVNWKALIQLIIPMSIGVVIGAMVGQNIPEALFKKIMAGVILFSGLLIVASKYVESRFPESRYFAWIIGILAGFCTMVGNLAGAFTNLYFLSNKFSKNAFIGTAAWLYLFINIIKVPFHVFMWGTITWSSLKENLVLTPFLLLGFAIGLYFVRRVSNQFFQRYILAMMMIGALLIIFS